MQGGLLHQALKYELGHAQDVRLIKVQLTDELGQPIVWRSLFGLRTAQAHIQFAVPLADGHWLTIDGQELQGWSGESAWVLISDYLLRVYALRIVAVLLVCLIAVRLCLRPLRRLADAARGLGSNLEQPPLALDGPEEVRQAAQAFNATAPQAATCSAQSRAQAHRTKTTGRASHATQQTA